MVATGNLQQSVDRLVRLAKDLGLKDITVGTTYGAPALKVKGKAFVAVKAAETMVLHCPTEMKEVLMEMAPKIYYQTDHYKGWPGLLVRLDVIGDEELSLRLHDAWKFRAAKTLTRG